MTGKGVDSAARQHRFKFLKSQSGLTAASVFSQAGSVASAAALRVVIRYTDMMHVLFTQKEDSSATLREKKKRLHVSVQCDGMEGIYNEPEAQTKHAHEHDLLSTGGRCKFLMTGRGIEKMTKSVTRFKAAMTYQTMSSCVSYHHCPWVPRYAWCTPKAIHATY